MRAKAGRPKKEGPRGKRRRGSAVSAFVRRGVKKRLELLLKAREWERKDLAGAANVASSTVTAWFGEPSTLPSGASLHALWVNAQVCPRWLLLDEHDLLTGSLADENWHLSLRDRIRHELLQRGHGSGFVESFLPEAPELAEQIVSDWLSRAIPAEKKYLAESRETIHQNAIRQLRMAEDILRLCEVRDPASTTPVSAISVRAVDPEALQESEAGGAGTFGPGVLEEASYQPEAPARQSKAESLSLELSAHLRAREQNHAAGEAERLAADPARQKRVEEREARRRRSGIGRQDG